MRLWFLALAAIAAAQTPVAPVGRAASPDSTADVVRIDAIATDDHGLVLDSLKAGDFELREDGFLQTIGEVRFVRAAESRGSAADPAPPVTSTDDERREAGDEATRLVGIYLDEFDVSPPNTARVRDALHRFVDTDLQPRDLVVILRPLDSLLTIRLTRDRAALHRTIDAFGGRRGDYEPRTAFERSYMASSQGRADAQRAQATWSTINALVLHLANLGSGRATILLVSERADPVSRQRGLEGLPTSSTVTRAANRSNVSIYVFDPRDANQRGDSRDEGPDLLRVLADDTGGALMADPSNVDAGLRRMMADASGYYLLTYHSVRNRDGLFHAVDVAVRRSGVRVRARRGYWAATPEEIQRAALVARAANPTPPQPLEPARHLSPLIRPWFGMARGANGNTRVTFVWEPSGVVPGDRRVKAASSLELHAARADGTSVFDGVVRPATPTPEAHAGPSTRAVFEVPPGRVRLRMSIQDAAEQAIDTDVRDLVVRDLRAAVVVGTPEVLRTRTAVDLRMLAAEPDAVPVASREFSRTERLVIRVPVYTPEGASSSLGASLVSRAGRTMRQLAVDQAALGPGRYQIDLPLAGLPPGEYSVAITAAGAAGEAKETVGFRVTD